MYTTQTSCGINSNWPHILGLACSCLVGLFAFQALTMYVVLHLLEMDIATFSATQTSEQLLGQQLRWGWLGVTGMSSIGAFIVAPWLYRHYIMPNKGTYRYCVALQPTHGIGWGLCLLITIAFMGVNTQAIEWNQGLVLPEVLSDVEIWIKRHEATVQRMTNQLTHMETVWDFLLALGVIAVVAAVGEEFFFRGLLQGQLQRTLGNKHTAVWIGALFFSFFHLQFYGFVPRLLLGVLFGYLYLLSANLWIPIFAHFVNNTIVLIVSYATQHGKDIGPLNTTAPAPSLGVSLGALLLTGMLIYAFYRVVKSKTTPQQAGNWKQIYTNTTLHQAEMLKELLIARDIQAIVINKKDTTFGWGGYSVYVEEEVTDKAKQLAHADCRFY